MTPLYVALWAVAGFSYWFTYPGFKSRTESVIALILMLVGGPLWWIGHGAIRIAGR